MVEDDAPHFIDLLAIVILCRIRDLPIGFLMRLFVIYRGLLKNEEGGHANDGQQQKQKPSNHCFLHGIWIFSFDEAEKPLELMTRTITASP